MLKLPKTPKINTSIWTSNAGVSMLNLNRAVYMVEFGGSTLETRQKWWYKDLCMFWGVQASIERERERRGGIAW